MALVETIRSLSSFRIVFCHNFDIFVFIDCQVRTLHGAKLRKTKHKYPPYIGDMQGGYIGDISYPKMLILSRITS